MRIDGGYILLSRKIDESEAMRLPPATREIWLYILRKVNHSDFKNLKRGENIFTYKKIQDDLCWYAGYRKMTYSKNDIAKSIRRLHERHMIDTTKATRGVIIKVVKYDVYQDPNNYEGHKEDTTKVQRKTQGVSTIYKNVYKKNNNNIPKGMDTPTYGNKDLISLKKFLINNYPKPLDGITDTRKLQNIKQVSTRRKNQDEWMDDSWKENIKSFLSLYLEETPEKYLVNSIDKLREKIKLWREYRGKLN